MEGDGIFLRHVQPLNQNGQNGQSNQGYTKDEADRPYENGKNGVNNQVKLDESTKVDLEPHNAYDQESEAVGMYSSTKEIVLQKKHFDINNASCFSKGIMWAQESFTRVCTEKKRILLLIVGVICLMAYFAYFGYAMYYRFGDEGSLRLLVCTIIGVLLLVYSFLGDTVLKPVHDKVDFFLGDVTHEKKRRIIRWILYISSTICMVTLIIVVVALDSPRNLLSLAGLAAFLVLCFLTSYSPAMIDWHPVFWGFSVQFYFAIIILKTRWGYETFQWLGDRVTEFLAYSDAGAKFVFGDYAKIVPFKGEPIEFSGVYTLHFFAFAIMPVITFFSTVISVLYYLGVMQKIILVIGRFLSFCLGTTPAESLNAAANIFVSMTESPLMIRPFIPTMTSSELHAVMVGGFATIAGSVLGAYIGFGVPADHLLSASVMSAPAALAISKITYPEIEVPIVKPEDYDKVEKSEEGNVIEAACNGAIMSAKIIACVVVNVMAFLSLLKFVNATLTWFGDRVGVENLTFELICSYILYPVALFMGTEPEDCRQIAELVGIKTFTNEFIAYQKLSVLLNNRKQYTQYVHLHGTNSTSFDGDDILLGDGTRLVKGILSPKEDTIPEVNMLFQDAASNTEFVWVDTESQKEHPAVDEPQSSFSLAPGVKLDKDIVFEKKPVDPGQVNIVARGILAIQQVTTNIFAANQRNHGLVTTMVFLCGYFIYFGFAMNFRFGDEGSIRLLVCTIIGILMMIYTHFGALFLKPLTTQMHEIRYNEDKADQRKKIKWALYIVSTVVTVTLIIVLVALKSPRNLLSLGGLAMFVVLGFLTSYSPALINWHPIYWGFTVQFYFAVLILKTKVGYNIFLWLGDRVTEFLAHSDAGAKFVFGDYGKIVPFVGEPIEFLDSFRIHLFAFTIMPVITFFSTVISVLYYLGVMQKIVLVIGRFLAFCLGTTPAESLNAAGNIFVSMTESPLMIRPYIGTMTSSELHAVMVGGFATIAGSVLGAYIGFGVDADHLLSASVMSAPAALAISKLTYPEIEIPIVTDADYLKLEGSKESNVIEAACSGAIMSTGIIACVMVNVMAFLSLLNFVNATLNWLGTRVGVANLSFELLCSYVMFPVALFMGTELQDCMQVAELVGIKTFTNEFIAFQKLAVYIGNRETYIDHIKHYPDDPVVVVGRDYYLGGLNGTRIDGGFISHRSETIATYALCGFSNVGSMGILLGSLSAMAPARKATMSRLIFRAMVAGNVACFVTACIAGLVFDQEDDKILNRGRR